MPRKRTSPWRYDRAAIRVVLETEGLDAARARWPRDAVDPLARVLGLTSPYKRSATSLTQEQVQLLGSRPDSQLAGIWALPTSTVRAARRLLGIRTTGAQNKEAARRLPDADFEVPLYLLSARVGIGVNILSAERRRRGINVFRRGRQKRWPVTVLRASAIHALRVAHPEVTLEDLAAVFGITRERVRQIELVATVESEQRSA